MSSENQQIAQMTEKINRLRQERQAIILVHNYQIPEVQDIADFLGDSLELSRMAAETDAEVIVFCGVHFMAETAKLLSPDKTVLLPDPTAGCPMADMIDAEKLRHFKADHPGVPVVAYVNTTAETKAESDICCTSANAVEVVRSLGAQQVLFVPDCHLASWIQEHTDTEIIAWQGYCPTHQRISPQAIRDAQKQHPKAATIVHPEAPKEIRDMADEVLSTGGMVRFARQTQATEIILGTEYDMAYRLRKENPDKTIFTIPAAVCPNMKKTTLLKIAATLQNMEPVIQIPADIADRARGAVERMLQVM
jgi:quinolinate synthase